MTAAAGGDAAPRVPPLARGAVDRAAHRRTDRAWLADAWQKARIVVVDDGHVLVREGEPPVLAYVGADGAPEGERFFLGVDAAEVPYFAVAADVVPGAGQRRVNLRQVGHALPDLDAGLFITSVALVN